MHQLQERLQALSALGHFFRTYVEGTNTDSEFMSCLSKTKVANGWFTPEVINSVLSSWGASLTLENLEKWLKDYNISKNEAPKTIALILAGNIPLVGLHDLVCIWITGHKALVKCASKDQYLLPFVAQFIDNQLSSPSKSIHFTKEKLSHYDAVIATGSNNSARYFDHYFGHVPHIIRKNRNGVAVLSGKESKDELEGLGNDILRYFGLGCRNVSKLLLPQGFDLNKVFGGLYPKSAVINNAKYANNYDYNKAVFLMSEFDFLENGFFLLKEDPIIAAPIACAFYEYYESMTDCIAYLNENKDAIQCVVSHLDIDGALPFGKAQSPELWDYADQVDTVQFLINLN